MAFNLSMNASDIDKTLVESRRLLDSDPATKQYVDEKATWEAMPDKPFGEVGGDTVTWDGNTEGLASVVIADPMYKVSDAVITESDLAKGFSLSTLQGETASSELFTVTSEGNVTLVLHSGVNAGMIMSGEQSDFANVGIDAPSGTYFGVTQIGTVSSLTIPGYTGFPSVKTLDEKFLPESVKGGSGGVVYVNVTLPGDGTATADMTFEEMENVLSSGGLLVAKFEADGVPTFASLVMHGAGAQIMFVSVCTSVGMTEGMVIYYTVVFGPNNQSMAQTMMASGTVT